ncbi:hypothetical protein NQ317_003043 [Molorchus minor]|uniref:Uncharacterized protein n=1 Tax=Molorchus minor TaxID=1323400 RepID=A0ABQ9JEU9_9CUCU|nr:hypothetical protein NQ317_003043 [Molorchus minor]
MMINTVAALLVAISCASASGIIGVGSARGALEGALGGQWIPDVPVGGAVVAGHAGIAGPLGLGLAGPLGLGLAGNGLGLVGNGLGLAGAGLGLAGHGLVSSRGAIEGALGGQWIPDTHGK